MNTQIPEGGRGGSDISRGFGAREWPAGRLCARAKRLRMMSVIWKASRCIPLQLNCFASRHGAFTRVSMSYNPYKKRGGGPNRGGGRGRGRGARGGRGRGGGPPPGLSGREIGLFYRNKSQAKKQEREKNEVTTILAL